MKTHLRLPITSHTKPLVTVGDTVTPKTPLFERQTHFTEREIHLAHLLRVRENTIAKYLSVKMGEHIATGTTLAEKKGWFSQKAVTSPISGVIKELDVKHGILTIRESDETTVVRKYVPLNGKVYDVSADYIEIETEGITFHANAGEGDSVFGTLVHREGEIVGVLDIDGDWNNSILVCMSITPETQVKLEVLGVMGIILVKAAKDFILPYVRLDESSYSKLITYESKIAYLSPKDKEVIVLS